MGRKNPEKSKGRNDGLSQRYKGKLDVIRSGGGFVSVEGLERDIMIRRENIGGALNGDEVRVEIIKGGRHGSRAEGQITEVITRKQTEFAGRLEVKEQFAFLIPDGHNMGIDVFVPLQFLHDGKDGDHAIVKIVEWSSKGKNPVGEVISILTGASANDAAMQSILVEAGFQLRFPDDVLEESARFSDAIDDAEVAKRWDLRSLLTMTIDPVDAKDFDDALSIRPLGENLWEVGVHIADVSHFLQKGTAMDKEAYTRATSVYLPDRVLPMLPEHLSNGLCSLRPDEDKYAFSAIFDITREGKVKSFRLGKSIIRSKKRFAYEDVQEMIEGAEGDHRAEVMLLDEMARNLRRARFKKGAINFSSQEVRFKLDEAGKPVGIIIKESKEANKLIEEFMLLANRTVAEYVSKIRVKDDEVPFPYRVHDAPNEEKLEVFSAFASRYGYKFNLNNPDSIAESFNEMLDAVKGTPQQNVLESLGIRTMAKAIYTTENIGHYGLGFDDYCHFTSPIRRYPDVIAHRILEECLEGRIVPVKNLEQQCRHCSDQERSAMEAERAGNKYKQVEYMQDFVGEDFEAVVSGVAPFGVFAETVAQKCEGMIGMAELSQIDDFIHIESDYMLLGQRTGIRLRMGDTLKVKVLSANLDKRQIDFALVGLPQGRAVPEERSPKAKKGGGLRPVESAPKRDKKKGDKSFKPGDGAPAGKKQPRKKK